MSRLLWIPLGADICPKINTQGGPVQGVCKQSTSLPPGYFVCSTP